MGSTMKRLTILPVAVLTLAGFILSDGLTSPLHSQVVSRDLRTRNMELVGYNGEVARDNQADTTQEDEEAYDFHDSSLSGKQLPGTSPHWHIYQARIKRPTKDSTHAYTYNNAAPVRLRRNE